MNQRIQLHRTPPAHILVWTMSVLPCHGSGKPLPLKQLSIAAFLSSSLPSRQSHAQQMLSEHSAPEWSMDFPAFGIKIGLGSFFHACLISELSRLPQRVFFS